MSAYCLGNANDCTEGICERASVFDGVHVIWGAVCYPSFSSVSSN